MNRGNLGDSEVSYDSTEDRLSSRPSRSAHNPYNRRTNSVTTRNPASAPSDSAAGSSRRKKRPTKRKTKVIKEIIRLQKSTDLLIPKLPFARLIREITMECNTEVRRYTLTALQAIQEATEMYITQLLSDANYLTLHRNRVTLSKGDIMLIRFLKHNY